MNQRVRANWASVVAYLGPTLAIAMVARSGSVLAQEVKPAARPAPNSATEPLAPVASMARAAAFLDDVALNWTREHECGTCHTNYPYLMARPALKDADAPAMAEVRRFFEERVAHWDDAEKAAKPRWDAEVVATAAALAINDAATTGRLHPLTRKALDRTWTLQKPAGGFDWLKCGWPPYEHDDYFGAVVAALGAGHAPDGYANSTAGQAGLTRLRAYFATNPPPDLHHATMLLWASARLDGLMTADQRARRSTGSAHSSGPTAAGTCRRWGPGNGATARTTIPRPPATAMPRAWPSSSSARQESPRPTRPSGAAWPGSSRTSAPRAAGSRDPSTTTNTIISHTPGPRSRCSPSRPAGSRLRSRGTIQGPAGRDFRAPEGDGRNQPGTSAPGNKKQG